MSKDRYCHECGIKVGDMIKSGLFSSFMPNEHCATPLGTEYRCKEHPQETS